jgi:O-antigen ligase
VSAALKSAAVATDGAPSLVPTFGVLCLLAFCFVIFSQKLPLGEIAALGALYAAATREGRLELPWFYRWFLLYYCLGVLGLFSSPYPAVVQEQVIEVAKFTVLGVAACNIITTPRAARSFAIGYLALYALFPIRGALYNYINGFTWGGRIAWNFFFANPNDLAIACFLPLGLCAFVIFLDPAKWVRLAGWGGLLVITGVQMLTQSRGAMVSLAVGVLYFVVNSKQRLRMVAAFGVLVVIAALATPTAVWERVAGLANFASGDVSKVDPEQSAAGRSQLMRVAAGIAADNPFLGIGLGAYPYENARVTRNDPTIGRDERGMRDAHSTYLRAAAETGILGGLAIVMCVASVIWLCRGHRRRISATHRDADGDRRAAAILALEASVIAYAFGCLFNSAERSTFFMLQMVVPCMLATVIARYATENTGGATEPAPASTVNPRLTY